MHFIITGGAGFIGSHLTEQLLDFICVKDVAIAFAKALTTPTLSSSSLICNVGTGNSISLIQLVEILKNCFPNWRSEIRFAPSRTGDIQHSQASRSRASSFLNFTPQWSVRAGMELLVQSQLCRSGKL